MDKSEIQQKLYYDNIAEEYDQHYASDDALRYRHAIYKYFLKSLSFNGIDVLDAMCGGGQSTLFFQQFGAKVTGIDISEGQCNHYRLRFPDNEVYCKSILDNGLPDGQFDFIITDSVHHIHPHVDQCMNEFYRLLKPGGYLMLWEPSAGSIFDYIRKLWYRSDKKYFQDNEASIDLKMLTTDNQDKFNLVRRQYGGNVAYVFIMLTMAMRLSNKRNKYIHKLLILIEHFFSLFQTRLTSLWFLALFQKK